MVESNNNLVIGLWILGALLFVSMIMTGVAVSKTNQIDTLSEEDVKLIVDEAVSKIVLPEVNVPTAEEIASLIDVPESDAKYAKDLWEEHYDTEINTLKQEAYDAVIAELEDDDNEVIDDWFTDNVDDFNKIKSVSYSDFDEDETNVEVLQYGLEDEEDKEAVVTLEMKVKYTLREGAVETLRMYMDVEGNVVFDEGDFGDEEVELTFE